MDQENNKTSNAANDFVPNSTDQQKPLPGTNTGEVNGMEDTNTTIIPNQGSGITDCKSTENNCTEPEAQEETNRALQPRETPTSQEILYINDKFLKNSNHDRNSHEASYGLNTSSQIDNNPDMLYQNIKPSNNNEAWTINNPNKNDGNKQSLNIGKEIQKKFPKHKGWWKPSNTTRKWKSNRKDHSDEVVIDGSSFIQNFNRPGELARPASIPETHKESDELNMKSTYPPSTERGSKRSLDIKSLGLFYWNTEILLFLDRLCMDFIMDTFSSVRLMPISIMTEEEWKSELKTFSSIILYHSVLAEKWLDDMSKCLEDTLSIYDPKNVIVMIGDLKNKKCEKDMRAQWSRGKFSSCELLLFTELELDWISPFHKGSHTVERSIGFKLNNIKDLLEREPSRIRSSVMTQKNTKHKVAIISRNDEKVSEWLRTLLKSELFQNVINDVQHIDISCFEDKKCKEISRCTFVVLYCTSYQFNIDLKFASRFEREKVIAVIDDLEDSSFLKYRILQNQPSILSQVQDLIIFSREEKEINYLEEFHEVKRSIQEKWTRLETLIQNQENMANGFVQCESEVSSILPEKHTIGIFSRSGQSDYSWLLSLLQSEDFSGYVQDVRPYYITNDGTLKLMKEVSKCTFGILYHTKNRGRVNVTDVLDSLYDYELKYLSDELGKEKVIVVIDDLDDSSSEEKVKILEEQPTIQNMARDLILFNKGEKESYKNNPGDSVNGKSFEEKYRRLSYLLGRRDKLFSL